MPTAADAGASRAVIKLLAASYDAFRHSIPLQERPDRCAAVGTRHTVTGDAQTPEMCGLFDR